MKRDDPGDAPWLEIMGRERKYVGVLWALLWMHGRVGMQCVKLCALIIFFEVNLMSLCVLNVVGSAYLLVGVE